MLHPHEAWRGVFERPRLDLIDALEEGVVIYDDGFWSRLRREYLRRGPYESSRIEGGLRYLRLRRGKGSEPGGSGF